MDREAAWLNFLRPSLNPVVMPREMFQTRAVVWNVEEYLRCLTVYGNTLDTFASVYSIPQLERGIFDTLFFEIDSKGGGEAIRLLKEVMKRLQGYHLRVYWSGRRGFHFYLDFPLVHLSHPSLVFRRFLRMRGILGKERLIDPTTAGNARQLVRVPYTIHSGTRLYCCRIYPDREVLPQIMSPPEDSPPIPNWGMSDLLLDIDMEIDKELRERSLSVVEGMEEGGEEDLLPPCIVTMLSGLISTGELSHQGRIELVSFLLKRGYPKEVLHAVLSKASDYDQEYTERQIEAIIGAEMNGYSCTRIREMGYCPLVRVGECPFYPWPGMVSEWKIPPAPSAR